MSERPRLLAFDLDGTLLADGGMQVPASTVRALQAYRERGGKLAIITGRDDVPPEVLALSPDALAVHNGAVVMHGGKIMASNYLSLQVLRWVKERQPRGGRVLALTQGAVYADLSLYPDEAAWRERWALSHRPFRPLSECPPELLGLWCFHPDAATWKSAVLAEFPDLSITGVQPPYADNMNISVAGVSKGGAVRRVAQLLGAPLSATWAFGDSDNDLPMFAQVGRAVGVGDLPLLSGVVSERVVIHLHLGEWLDDQLQLGPSKKRD